MKKRTFKLVALAVLIVVCMCATTLLTACNKKSTYYLSTESNNWTTYGRKDSVPDNVRFTLNSDGTYSLKVTLEAGDSFAIYKAGSEGNLVKSIFTTSGQLTLANGNVKVNQKGEYVLTLDVESGELSYTFKGEQQIDPDPVAVTGVTLNTDSLSLTVGDADVTLTATVLPANATNKNVSWSSDNTNVATVAGGVVHVVGAGKAIITVTTEDGGKTATCEVNVSEAQQGTVHVESVSLNPNVLNLTVGDADVTLTANVLPANATNKNVSWSSDNTDVATVAGGVVHVVGAGKAIITVTTEDGGKTATCEVNVTESLGDDKVDVEEIYFGELSLEIMETESQTLTVYVEPDNATNKSYKWEVVSGDEAVAQLEIVTDGLKVTGLKAGEVTIKLVSISNPEVESDEFTITVTALELESLEIIPSELELELNGEYDLQVKVTPAAASTTLTWSSNSDCVEVDQEGHVKAVSAGKATITVKDISGKTATCAVTVPQHVTSISLSESALNLYVGGSNRELTVVFNPSDATNKNFTAEIVSGSEYAEIVSTDVSSSKVIVRGILAGGTATLRVTSEDGSYTAECTLTVQDLTYAVPYLSASSMTVDIGSTDAVQVLSDDNSVTAVTFKVGSTSVATVEEAVANSSFSIQGVAFGTTTVTFTVTYGNGSTTTLTLTVLVSSDYYYLTGTIDGGDWDTQSSKSDASSANLLLEEVSDGKYSITRDIDAGTSGVSIFILPSNLDTDWNYALKNPYYTAQSNASDYKITTPDVENVLLSLSGNYTITLDLSGTKASWTVVINKVAPTSASITSDKNSLTEGDADDTATLTLTIGPDYELTKVEAEEITWTIDEQYKSWFTITFDDEDRTCKLQLISFEGEDQVTVTITVTITVGTFKVTTVPCSITLLPEGEDETPVSNVIWDTKDVQVNVTSEGWTTTLAAHVDDAATTKGVTYELVADANGTAWTNIYVNDDGSTLAFSIDASSGVITAKMFGTIYVRAVSVGEGNTGSPVYSEVTTVTFYANAFQIQQGWNSAAVYTDTTSNTVTEYKWEKVQLSGGVATIIVYDGLGSDWTSVIRSDTYFDSSSTNASATSGSNGQYTLTKTGYYNVTLDLSGLKPLVKFDFDSEITSTDTFKMAVYIVGDGTSGWSETGNYYGQASDTLDPTADKLTITISDADFTGYKIWGDGIGFLTQKDDGDKVWYSNGVSTDVVTISGSKITSSWNTAGKWVCAGTCQLKYDTGSTPGSFTFKFTFDSTGSLTAITVD